MDPEPRTRRSAWRRMRSRPVLAGGAVVLLAGAAVVLLWFQPQVLLYDVVVEDDFPVSGPAEPGTATPRATTRPAAEERVPSDAAPSPTAPTAPPPTPEAATSAPAASSTPSLLRSGAFQSRNRYTVAGRASVYELGDGSRTLRLEEFSSTNGPDLFVYLTVADHADADTDLGADYVDLGVLRGNVGNQTYDVPDGVDLDHYDTAVIWCRRFTVSFGAADLAPPT